MENGFLPDDWGLCHRYITNFASRVIIVSIIETIIVFFLYKLKFVQKIPFSIYFVILLLFVGSFIDNAGNLFGWFSVGKYYSVVWYDDFVHFISSLILAVSFFCVYYNFSFKVKLRSKNNVLIISALAFLTSFAFGTIFGIYEYYSDIFLDTYMVGGVEDAVTDNVFDFGGSFLAFIILNTPMVKKVLKKYWRYGYV